MVFQVRYQILKSLLPFRRMHFIALIVGYALRRKRNGWGASVSGVVQVGSLGISNDAHRALNDVSMAFVGCLFPFPSFNFAFCSTGYKRLNGTSNEMKEEINYRKVGNFLFLLFRAFWHGRGCGSRSVLITSGSALRLGIGCYDQQTTLGWHDAQ